MPADYPYDLGAYSRPVSTDSEAAKRFRAAAEQGRPDEAEVVDREDLALARADGAIRASCFCRLSHAAKPVATGADMGLEK